MAPSGLACIDFDQETDVKRETEYFLKRASEETRRAIGAEEPNAADAHAELAARYSAKAVTLIVEEEDSEAPGPDVAGG